MYNKNRIGPKMDPCEASQSDNNKDEWQLSMDTNW